MLLKLQTFEIQYIYTGKQMNDANERRKRRRHLSGAAFVKKKDDIRLQCRISNGKATHISVFIFDLYQREC